MRRKTSLILGFFPAADEALVFPDFDRAEGAAMMFAARIGVGVIETKLGFRFQEMITMVEKAEQIVRVVVSIFHVTPRTQQIQKRADSTLRVNIALHRKR